MGDLIEAVRFRAAFFMCFYGRFDWGNPISGCLFYVFLWKIWLRQSNFGLPFLCAFMEDLNEAVQFRAAFFMCFYGRFERGNPISGCLFYVLLWKIERGSPISDCLFLCGFMEDLIEAVQFRTAFFYVFLWKIWTRQSNFGLPFFMWFYGRFEQGNLISDCLFLCVYYEIVNQGIEFRFLFKN